MMTRPLMQLLLALALLGAGCVVSTPEDNPYDVCAPGDICAGGLTCAASTLPAGSSFTGSFCTSGCNTSADCLQVPQNQTATCVNGQCYLQCPSGGIDCPYGQACFTFDSNVGPISLCSP